jgi:hypothetical protein
VKQQRNLLHGFATPESLWISSLSKSAPGVYELAHLSRADEIALEAVHCGGLLFYLGRQVPLASPSLRENSRQNG